MAPEFETVIERLSKGREDLIVFAGGGVATGTGVADWKELLRSLDEKVQINHIDIDRVEENQYPDIAQKFFDHFSQQGQENCYYNILEDKLNTIDSPHTTMQTEILKTTNHVITTNFERSFETAFKYHHENDLACPCIQYLPSLSQAVLFHGFSFTYLHGSIHARAIIFKRADYDSYYPSVSSNSNGSDVLEQFLRHVYTAHILVFVGFSFRDTYVVRSLENIHARLRLNDERNLQFHHGYRPLLDNIQHYAFLKRSDITNSAQLKERLALAKVQVLEYEQHKDWVLWFKRLRERTRKASLLADALDI